MKQCPKCKTSVEESYLFCPWCGKPMADKNSNRSSVGLDVKAEKLNFTEEDQALFKNLLACYYEERKICCSPERVCWEDSYTGWGALDDGGSWENTRFFVIRPLRLDEKEKYVENSVIPESKAGEQRSLLRTIADNSDKCLFYESLPAHREGKYLNIHWRDTLIVSNPYGVGMDIICIYESYDDKG